MSSHEYGYTEYLARDKQGHLLTHDEFRALVAALHLHDADLASLFGVHEATISRWRHGLGMPYPRHQRAILEFVEFARQRLGASYQRRIDAYIAQAPEDFTEEDALIWTHY
jgi:transcriptional regulator with XRE-family HTH domain